LDGEGLPGRDRQGAAAPAQGEGSRRRGIRYAPRPPFAACRRGFLDLCPHRAVPSFLAVLGWVAPFVSARCGMGALRNSSAPFSPSPLFFLALLYLGNKECGLGWAVWHACRIPFDGRPAVNARFGRELMREESHDFSGRDWPNLSDSRGCR